MKPKVRFLVPVWGEAYINRFAALSLPSFLAPGNLPALAAMVDLEVCILAVRHDQGLLERLPTISALRSIAPLRFIPIDDLVLDQQYGVTLTLAYLRGITETGPAMLDRHFLFMNSDIVLADGSFQSVGKKILEGHRVILANSIRAISEELEPRLRAEVAAERLFLAVPPRRLVNMAMECLHPSQIAKIVNNDFCHSVHANQFYWQVDATTLVSRHFLMFMLALKPERVVTEVQSFCDYSFVPEFCPSARPIAMEDSDDFFALELQNRRHEEGYLRLGRPRMEEVAKSLSVWTTAPHRNQALGHTLIFHGAELPAETPAASAEADRYIAQLTTLMAPDPQPFRGHPYWLGAYYLWRLRKSELEGTEPPESPSEPRPPATENGTIAAAAPSASPAVVDAKHIGDALASIFRRRLRKLRATLAQTARGANRYLWRHVVGFPPDVRIWHPDWLDYRPLKPILERYLRRGRGAALYVTTDPAIFGHFLEAPVLAPDRVLESEGEIAAIPPASLRLVLIEPPRDAFRHIRDLIKKLQPLVQKDSHIVIFRRETTRPASVPGADLGDALVHNIDFVAPRALHKTSFVFAGGYAKFELRGEFDALAAQLATARLVAFPWFALRASRLLLRTRRFNREQASIQDARISVGPCSSVTIIIEM